MPPLRDRTAGASTPLAPPTDRILRHAVTGVQLRVVRSGSETNGAELELEASYPPGSSAPPDHFHPRQEERFTVLAGTLRVRIRRLERSLAPGDELVIPAGTPHAMWNPGADPARVRWITAPALRTEEFFRAVYRLAEEGRVAPDGTPRLADLARLAPRYRNEVRLTPTLGLGAVALFFAFGTAMATLASVALLFPGGALDSLWRLNPPAQAAFRSMGPWAIVLLVVVAALCAASAAGLWIRARWGRHLAILLLVANLVGDAANALVRGDLRTLVGLPAAGLLIAYLQSRRVRLQFPGSPDAGPGRPAGGARPGSAPRP